MNPIETMDRIRFLQTFVIQHETKQTEMDKIDLFYIKAEIKYLKYIQFDEPFWLEDYPRG